MTPELQNIITRYRNRADTGKFALADLNRCIKKMEKLAVKDEWDHSEEIEWMHLEKQAYDAWQRTRLP